jgi:putative glutamine amidotransferase
MTKPLIGITSSREPDQYVGTILSLPEAYIRAVSAAGGIPVCIPLGLPEAYYLDLLPRLNGVLFSGGGDVHPNQYGSQMHPRVYGIDTDRDRVEVFLAQEVRRVNKPFLGICRGLQVINTAFGGTLFEDIRDQKQDSSKHQYSGQGDRSFRAHPVSIEPDSLLARLVGESSEQVNSLHHQGIGQLASSLTAVAWSPDGIIEAFEAQECLFGLAVQWHPEWLQDDPAMQRLFTAFIDACRI